MAGIIKYPELLTNEEFLGFCGRWEEDFTIPFPFEDWLMEHGYPDVSKAAHWAANFVCPPYRDLSNKNRSSDKGNCLYPWEGFDGYQWCNGRGWKDHSSNYVPIRDELFEKHGLSDPSKNFALQRYPFPESILRMLSAMGEQLNEVP